MRCSSPKPLFANGIVTELTAYGFDVATKLSYRLVLAGFTPPENGRVQMVTLAPQG